MDTNINQLQPRLIPPKEIFRGDELEVIPTNGIAKQQLTTPVYNIELPESGGILSYHEGDAYPVKGWPFKEAVYACDTIKRAVLNAVKLATSSPIRYVFGLFFLLPRSLKTKIVNKALWEFGDYTHVVFDVWGRIMPMTDDMGNQFGVQGVVIKPKFYCDMAREIYRVGSQMIGDPDGLILKKFETEVLTSDELNMVSRMRLLTTICMILEFDDAYRYRVQDGCSELNMAVFWNDPAKELTRVLRIMIQRSKNTSEKFETFAKLIPFLFNVSLFKSVINEFFARVDLKKLSLDEIDFYRCLLWGGYQFRGMSDAERVSLRLMIDSTYALKTKEK